MKKKILKGFDVDVTFVRYATLKSTVRKSGWEKLLYFSFVTRGPWR